MKLLVISSYLPYPLDSGGHVRLYNLLSHLSAKHEITLICEMRTSQTNVDVTEMQKICKKVLTVPRKKQWSIENIIKSGGSKNSFLVTGHRSKKMQQLIIQELAKEIYDLIHVETYYVMQNLPDVVSLPVVLAEHNIEYTIYEKYAAKLPVFLRPLLHIDIEKIKKEERGSWARADTVLAVSHEDSQVMQAYGVKPLLVPNGVNTNQFAFKPKKIKENDEKKLLFLGNFKWIQNSDAVKFLLQDILPEIKKANRSGQNIKVWIVGRTIPQSLRTLTTDPDVLFDEVSAQKSAPELFHEAALLVAPIRVGGGTSYKILEAMSCGTPVVTMPMSAKAIGAIDDESILVATNSEIFAKKTVQILEDSTKYDKIANGGRTLIEKHFMWDTIGKQLENAYLQTLQK